MSRVLKNAVVLLLVLIIFALLGCIYSHEQPVKQDAKDGAPEAEIVNTESKEDGETEAEQAASQEDAVKMTQTVRLCANQGKTIYGILFTPESGADEPYPLVIYSHGLGGVSNEATDFASHLVSLGAAVYAFDFCGGSPLSRSEGKPDEMSLMTEIADLEAVIEQAQTWKEVDDGRIALAGHSQGGAVSAIAAARQKEKIGGLILMAPAFNLQDYARTCFESKADIPPQAEVMGVRVGRTYFEAVWDYDIYAEIGGFGQKVLLIHGSGDSAVAPQYSERALNVYDDAELMLIEGGEHGVYWDARERINEQTSVYLKQIGFIG